MKALTVWQPWASLIIEGAKPYEFRGWRAPKSIIGQRVVIHAAARNIDRAEVLVLLDIIKRGPDSWKAETCLHCDEALPILEMAATTGFRRESGYIDLKAHGDLPWACGLGTAIVGEPRLGTEIAEEFGVPRANDSDRDEHANWGWPMLEIERWPEPIPMKGMQGFWTWPEPSDVGL